MSKSWMYRIRLAACVLATTCAAWSPARAAVVIGTFDPAFGAAIPNLGYKGSALFQVPDACLALSGLVLNGNGCSNNTMSLLSAQVQFYNLATPAVTLLNIGYGANSLTILAADIINGQVDGLDTTISLSQNVTIAQGPGASNVNFSGPISLQFFTGKLNFGLVAADDQAAAVQGIGGAVLYTCGPAQANFCAVQNTSNTAGLTFALVPEPSSTSLVLAALAALGLLPLRRAAARRRG